MRMLRKMGKSEILEEYQRAKAESRQPECPYCRSPLEIKQTQLEYVLWKWNAKTGCYDVELDGEGSDPFCAACGTQDRGFIDHDLVDF